MRIPAPETTLKESTCQAAAKRVAALVFRLSRAPAERCLGPKWMFTAVSCSILEVAGDFGRISSVMVEILPPAWAIE